MSTIAYSRACRPGYGTMRLVAVFSIVLYGCAPYSPPPLQPVGDSAMPAHRFTVRFVTSDGATHELTRIRVARDTLFGIPAPGGGPEVGFALPEIRRFDKLDPTPPRPYVTRVVDTLWFMPFLMIYAIVAAI